MLAKRIIALILTILFLSSGLAALNGAVGEVGSKVTPPKIATLHVNLTYTNSSPASGIKIYVFPQYSGTWSSNSYGTTDPSGKVTITIRGYDIGPCYIQASNATEELWIREKLYVEPGRTYYRDIVLTPGLPKAYTIEGTVRYLSNGTAVRDASYQVSGSDALGRQSVFTGFTPADGRFSCTVAMSEYSYMIYVSNGVGTYSNNVFLNSSKTVYSLDIRLRSNPSSLPLNVRFLNDNTGKPVPNPDINMWGIKAYDDHLPYSNWFWSVEPSGWLNQTMGRGEYFYYVSTSEYHGDGWVRYSAMAGVLMNDTPITKEFRLRFPTQLRNITFLVKEKGTGTPLSGAYISSSQVYLRGTEYDLWSNTGGTTNATGYATLSYIPMRPYTIWVSEYMYNTVQLDIPPGPASGGDIITIELEKQTEIGPGEGNVSILAKDQLTGRVLPYYSVEGNGPSTYFYGETGPNGYLNTTIPAGDYYNITIYGNLGKGKVDSFTIADGQTRSLTVQVTERKGFDKSPNCQYTFRVVDEVGSPIPNIYVPIVKPYLYGYDSYYSYSDQNGYVRLTAKPGTYKILENDIYDPISGKRQHYAPRGDNTIVLQAPGGIGPDITLYSSAPFSEVTGVVKDLRTGSSLHSAEIAYTTGKEIDGGQGGRDLVGSGSFDVRYMSYTTYSFTNGYYRLYGKDMIYYSCYLNGYFPKTGVFDLTTRALDQNIYLEPLLSKTTYINGTLMDYLGNPESGEVYVFDLDREEYLVNNTSAGNDGLFSIGVYPGRFRIHYYNETLSESMELTVGPEGVENLQLILTPETLFYGKVVNWEFAGIGNISVELFSGTDFENGAVTNEEGMFFITAEPGSYTLVIGESELYDGFSGGPYVATGFNEFNLTIVLENRTTGSVLGKVIGDGPAPEAIANADVVLWDPTMSVSWPTTANETGEFRIDDVPYGTGYTLAVDPPGNIKPDEGTSRSGYLNTTYGPFDLSSPELTVDVHLEYVVIQPPGYYNITSYTPTGDDVYLNAPIVIHFSHSMNVSTLKENITIDPELEDPELEWRDNNMTLMITHSGFQPNATYTVTVFGNLLSVEGFRLYGAMQKSWNFTTGTENMTWRLDESFVEVADNGTVKARVSGAENLTVFMVIDDLGSFKMKEAPAGTYRVTIDGEEFEWGKTYTYHFSDTSGGVDKAPHLANSFEIPVGQITSAKVTVRSDKDWQVQVEGSPNLDIYIVIQGVGSFKLDEGSPGKYSLLIDGSNFNWSKSYPYYFSTTPGGAAPSEWVGFSGTQTMPKEKKGGDDSGDWWLFCCIPAVLLALLLLVIIVIVLVVKKGKGKEEEKKEAAGWGEE